MTVTYVLDAYNIQVLKVTYVNVTVLIICIVYVGCECDITDINFNMQVPYRYLIPQYNGSS